MNENATKTIVLPSPKEIKQKIDENHHKIIQKEAIKRQITNTKKWTFLPADILQDQQPNHLYDEAKQSFIYQQIRAKLASYRAQDIEKKKSSVSLMDVSGVIQKLEDCEFKCFYCKEIVLLLYENVRDPRQWTLERLDNRQGHVLENIEIACLSCNLRRRTMKYERYIMTKEIKTVVKTL